ncbi:MAG: M20/M25/M40 family metallo-hydrolase [Clostridia bacterium]|nr:M20/M25/M40 family metallo-hydrolase [Clostridia bacterium]
MKLTQDMEQYIQQEAETLKQLIRDIAVIPAPSRHEEKRAEWVTGWWNRNGEDGAFIDEALNVVLPVGVTEDNDLYVFMAHTDVVFPDTEPLPFSEDETTFHCPGVGDDTACLAVLLMAARYFLKRRMPPKTGLLIVANSCEEGLGNLKGSRKIVDTWGSRIRGFVTVDGELDRIVDRAVGSHRYRVSVHTEGGHSYGAFGNRNAIACLASMITALYSVKVPERAGTKTTYNVGGISGGTSVNTIAQDAEMLYEYRSDDAECLEQMHRMFMGVISAWRGMGVRVDVEQIGDRPCGSIAGREDYDRFIEKIQQAAESSLGFRLKPRSSSTDANYPLSLGIPAVCIGGCHSVHTHCRDEFLYLDSLQKGFRLLMAVLGEYFEVTENS